MSAGEGGELEDQGRGGKVRVIDRRSFTADGDPKDGRNLPDPPASAAAATTESSASTESGAPPSPEDHQGKPGFLDLVDFFAQQAAVLLSEKAPGHENEAEAARYLIDLLAVVEEKTRSQLSAEEKRYVDHVLFQLRTLFVASAR